MSPQQPSISAGSALEGYRHVCAFFHTQDEEYRVLLPFIKKESIGAKRHFTSSTPSCWKIIFPD